MPRRARFALLVLAQLALVACDDGGSVDPTDTAQTISDATVADTQGDTARDGDVSLGDTDSAETVVLDRARARFEPGPDGTLPFPFDAFTEPAETPTGIRIALGESNSRLVDDGLDNGLLPKPELLSALAAIDGFSLHAAISIAWEGPLDVAALGPNPGPSDGLHLVDVDPDSPEFGIHRRVSVRSIERLRKILLVEPEQSLLPGHTYALVITDAMMDVDPRFQAALAATAPADPDLERAHAALAPLRDNLDGLGLSAGSIAIATVFTTQSGDHAMRDAAARIEATTTPTITIDRVDPSGAPMIHDFATLPDAPTEDIDLTGVGPILTGLLTAPDFRGPSGDLELAADGTLANERPRELPFLLVLPEDPALQPCPVIVIQHGSGARKEYVFYLAAILNQAGFALAAMDLPNHGERAGEGNFFALDEPAVARGTFMQAESDLVALMHGLRALEVDGQALDVIGDTDAVPDLALDGGIYYAGMSLGGITGSVANSLSSHSAGAVINVAGGGLSGLIDPFLVVLGDNLEMKAQVGVLFQTLIDGADPLTFVPTLRANAPDGAPRDVLMQVVIDDSLVRNSVSRRLAEAAEIPLVCPCPVEGTVFESMARVDAPQAERGLTLFPDTTHGVLLSFGDPAGPAMHRQIAAFFAADVATGTGSIVVE